MLSPLGVYPLPDVTLGHLFIITVNNSNVIIAIVWFQSIIYCEQIYTIKIAINHQEFTTEFPCGAKVKI